MVRTVSILLAAALLGGGCGRSVWQLEPPGCGNGVVEPGEVCDDGNEDNQDDCLNTCERASCGDGYVWVGVEECDDGDIRPGDGCSPYCLLEETLCPNGLVEWDEECDDGNLSNEDGCLATCQRAACGDGYHWAGVEQCDDGNVLPDDGCSSTCQIEAFFCGNGVVEANEECDDGNSSPSDECTADCRWAVRGDGVVWIGREQCDDGNVQDGDGCSAGCENEGAECGNGTLEVGEECDDGNLQNSDACLSTCQRAFCGDGFLRQGGEQCDDGNTQDGDGCSALCRLETATCGNSVVEVGEECDDGNGSNGDDCLNSCRNARCGDGFIWSSHEVCDDGNILPGDGCSPQCAIEPPDCGDGDLDPGEACDDGNTSNSDGCLSICQLATCGDGYRWIGVEVCDDANTLNGDGCSADCLSSEICGNGVVDTAVGEVCDDGNILPGDGCSVDCRSDETCGNAVVDVAVGEMCDDGNASGGDGCSADCRSDETCGNGYLDLALGEVCDDGNVASGDGCSADCQSNETCGNGLVDTPAGEVCDDSNTVSGDGCSADCRSNETCGNGVVDVVTGEQCDDGNTVPGDGCAPNCRPEGCFVDIELGILPVGELVGRGMDVSISGDDEVGCGSGPEVVVAFTTSITADVRLEIAQFGDHAYGLYQGTAGNQCAETLVACYDPGGFAAGDTIFEDLPAGRYYLVVESFDPSSAGTAWIWLTVLGDVPGCGNGVPDPGEACDDGNTVSGDGCSADCRSTEICGNGYLDIAIGEACDDGNTVSGDGCSADCQSDETCGNGVLDTVTGEVCDDGNRRSGDGCSADCQSDETCGNSILDTAAGEGCDDGNLLPGDGCDETCQIEPGSCYVDEDLGLMTPGVPVTRTLDVASAGDEWLTGCASSGPDVVTRFDMDRTGNIDLIFWQTGDHAVGLYTEGQVTDVCVATGGVCLDRDPNRPGHVIFMGRPAGTYYLIVEGNGPGWAGSVDIYLWIHGCAPDVDLGALVQSVDASALVDTQGGTDQFEAGCGGASGLERVVAFQLSAAADLRLEWSQVGDHVFGLMDEGGGACDNHPVACHDPTGIANGSTVFPRLDAGNYLILVDAFDPADEGPVQLTLRALPPTP